jgi:2,3-bisphosphoglycerate-independent phosphoglycerate mutase
MSSAPRGPVCLVILDGWGLAPPGSGNAITLAHTPFVDRLTREGAEGERVIRHALTATPRVHLIVMASDGGVHSSLSHLLAIIALAQRVGTRDLVVHAITNGRDTAPDSGRGFVATLEEALSEGGRIASLSGRWWSMDRDHRWERTQAAYDLLVHGRAPHHQEHAVAAVQAAYERGQTDEFIDPTLVGADGRIRAQDCVLCVNFRPDRMRQLVRALAEPGFGGDESRCLAGADATAPHRSPIWPR